RRQSYRRPLRPGSYRLFLAFYGCFKALTGVVAEQRIEVTSAPVLCAKRADMADGIEAALAVIGWGGRTSGIAHPEASKQQTAATHPAPTGVTNRACGALDTPTGRLVMERDLNAAITLAKLADSSAASLHACGEGSAGGGLGANVQLPALRQKPGTRYGWSMLG